VPSWPDLDPSPVVPPFLPVPPKQGTLGSLEVRGIDATHGLDRPQIFYNAILLWQPASRTSPSTRKLFSIGLHRHSPLLQSKRFCFPLISGVVRKVFLQELCPEISPSHLLFTSLHQLLHPHSPVLSVCHKKECDKGQLLCISAPDRLTYLLTLPQPCICLVQGGLASELSWPMPHEIFHSHGMSRCDSDSGLCCIRLHRVHHPMNRMSNLISPSIIPPSFVCQSLGTPHFSWIKPHNLSHDYASKRLNTKELTHWLISRTR